MVAEISVISYSILLAIVLLLVIKRYKVINATILCIALYFISSLTSIYFFNNGIYNYSSITIAPLIYIFICILITLFPLLKYDNVTSKNLLINNKNQRFLDIIILIVPFITIEPFIENIIHIPKVIFDHSSLALMYDIRADGEEQKMEYLSWVGRKLFWINHLTRDIYPVLLLYYLIYAKKIAWKKITYILFGICNPWIHGLALGGRVTLIEGALYFLFVYILFRQFLNEKRKHNMDRLWIVLSILIIVGTAIVTIARFDSSNLSIDIWTWVSLYTGEGVLNFSTDLWPIVDKTCNGDNTFLLVRFFLGLTDSVDIESVRATRDFLGVRNSVFYTYVGTIYYDFNRIGTVIFILSFTFIFCKSTKIKNNTVRLSQLTYLCILGKVLMMGVMFYPYTLSTAQWSVFYILLFSWILHYNEKVKKIS